MLVIPEFLGHNTKSTLFLVVAVIGFSPPLPPIASPLSLITPTANGQVVFDTQLALTYLVVASAIARIFFRLALTGALVIE